MTPIISSQKGGNNEKYMHMKINSVQIFIEFQTSMTWSRSKIFY